MGTVVKKVPLSKKLSFECILDHTH